MLIKTNPFGQEPESQVTDEGVFLRRRRLLRDMGFLGAGALLAGAAPSSQASWFGLGSDEPEQAARELAALDYQPGEKISEQLTSEAKVTSYNNFYEFGTGKDEPQRRAKDFQVDPWTVKITGLVEQEITLGYEDLFAFELQERIYRMRCVEAWSMVIPWVGFPLKALLDKAGVKSNAKYVAFETLYDPKQMPGQASRFVGGGIKYPYVEGLRLDEAMHPLTIMAVGVYGKAMPPQNGAPIRLVVPWKYGFKGIKSIVAIKLVEREPPATWNLSAPNEYGFYANVNPEVSHPRWSQATERRITTGGLGADKRIPTLPFNGYADQVASLYKGMDLATFY